MHQSLTQAIHCINPNCPRPYPQPGDNKFCNDCGTPLELRDRYIPLKRLGLGGFAAIYSVWDKRDRTQKVLKVLLDTSPKLLELFQQEAEVLVQLHHPGIPSVEKGNYFLVNLPNSQGRYLPCLVMEKINGETLEEILNLYPQGCPEKLVLDWLIQAVDILEELHNFGIIHRDIKPSNLMLRQETGQLVLIDFGGVKQLGETYQNTSTRLFSPGYSPPEQIAGEIVDATADFYALGRTMIQLLTGKDLAELHDRITGEFRWRNFVSIGPALANLLDDTIRINPQYRPATATEIKQRLKITLPKQRKPPTVGLSISQTILSATENLIAASLNGIAIFGEGISSTISFIFRTITNIVLACLDTTLEIILAGLSASIGAIFGLILINSTKLDNRLTNWLSSHWLDIFPDTHIKSFSGIILFAIAGLFTAWGITVGGGFGQNQRPLIAGFTGILGYSLSWLIWQMASLAGAAIDRLILVTTAIAVFPLILGLGLPSHYIVHGLVAAGGTGIVFQSLFTLDLLPKKVINDIFIASNNSPIDIISSVGFFCLLGVTIAFWLGVSYYLLVPILRWLGWR
ncbi:MAG TPA: serine/threonine protein kinase [Cyanobacteria bacterium UBA11149]|nr:serine/threonine protein kinase [Cyanobacteria bacterium UBA11367]HBE60186.1 serine/threonine protein kinase [Cyanobacteria bacterium UBA11366]HBK64066.1 serine/threonine protein kinase [Cyanobacteria bacterium UBA11166]HBR75563.1 serine/threonine protein kinase [Cyanobacteria bacterium UBA11159]HBS72410.1 serine/threonine protein kinase [Cyanobacteria bacterium UBA11153]HBW89849.1 serine/threonine protein kinase [Cyanobacteria bacterium UBA11149]HCA94431.1 serine/threonine protein kinase 